MYAATMKRSLALVLALGTLAVLVLGACKRTSKGAEPHDEASAPATAVASVASGRPSVLPPPPGLEPMVLLTLPVSAYRARLALDGNSIYVLTEKTTHRLVPGQEPEQLDVVPGLGAVVLDAAFVYWSDGAAWRAPKRGGKPKRIVSLERQPQSFVGAGDEYAWIVRSGKERLAVQTGSEGESRDLYVSTGRIDTATMVGDWVFFTERGPNVGWRLGRVPLSGGGASFTKPRTGRTPSMLASWDDHLYFYEGPERGVRRLSPDFFHEDAVIQHLVCSPLAVGETVYCAQVEGLVALVPGGVPQRLTSNDESLIPALAVNDHHVVWLSDVGSEQLVVKRLPPVAK